MNEITELQQKLTKIKIFIKFTFLNEYVFNNFTNFKIEIK
jgi:hypothetical protein